MQWAVVDVCFFSFVASWSGWEQPSGCNRSSTQNDAVHANYRVRFACQRNYFLGYSSYQQ